MDEKKARKRVKLAYPTAQINYLWKRDGRFIFTIDERQVVEVDATGQVHEVKEFQKCD